MEVDDETKEDIKEAILKGNINVTNESNEENNNEVLYSKEALEATKKHEKLIENINAKRIKQNLKIPTNDDDVKLRLRTLGEPICYFGEDASDRRERLKNVLTKMTNEGKIIPEFRQNRKQLLNELHELSNKINSNRPYFTKGHPWLKKVRMHILKDSMKKAEKRIKSQKRNKEHPITQTKKKQNEKELSNYLSAICCESSELIRNERPLTSIKISPKIFDLHNFIIDNQYDNESDNESDNEDDSDIDMNNSIQSNNSNDNNKMNDNDHQNSNGNVNATSNGNSNGNSFKDRSEYIISVGSRSGNVTLWNENGVLLKRIECHEERITGITWIPNTKCINDAKFVTGSADKTAKMFDINGKLLCNFKKHTCRLGRVGFHNLNNYLVTCSYDRTWCLWDINLGEKGCILQQEGHSNGVYCNSFHPDGSLIAIGDLSGILRIWDLRSGRAIMGLDGHANSVLDCDFNPNGYILLSVGCDNCVKVWDLRKQTEYTIISHNNLISSVKYETKYGGKWFATGSFDKLINIYTGKQYKFNVNNKLIGHELRISDIDINDDSNFIVSCSHDKTWKLWSNNQIKKLDFF